MTTFKDVADVLISTTNTIRRAGAKLISESKAVRRLSFGKARWLVRYLWSSYVEKIGALLVAQIFRLRSFMFNANR